MQRLVKISQRFSGNEQGALAIFVALCLTVMLTASGVAFEMSKYTKAKARFNNALDQALLAAAAANPSDLTQYAKNYFMTNLSEQGLQANVSKFTINVNGDKSLWTAEAEGTMNTSFASFVGVDAMSLKHKASVAWDASTTTELVAMVDVSGTMCANFQRMQTEDGATVVDFVPDRGCTKINQMKEALKQITGIGIGYTGGGAAPSYKVGIVPFTYKVKLPNPDKVPAFLVQGEKDAGYGDDYFKDLTDAEGGGPPLPLVTSLMSIGSATDKQNFLNKVAALSTPDNQEFARPFMKRSSMGAELSAMMLDPEYNAMFGGEKPAEFGAPNTKKIVIMMTDSANLGCCFTNWPETNFRNHYIYSYSPDHNALVGANGQAGICKAMKEKGIEIYTVLLDVNPADMDARGAEIVQSFKDCASDPDHAFEVPRNDEAKLKQAYTIIGKAIMKLRLTE